MPFSRVFAVMTIAFSLGIGPVAAAGQVNVYSYRQPFLVAPLFEKFTQATGIEVKVVFAKKGLIERVEVEGKSSPADVLLMTDISKLVKAGQTIAQPVNLAALNNHIPARFRDGDNRWFGLTRRARIGYVSTKIDDAPASFAELTDKKYRGRVCLRSGQHPYNNALFAAMILQIGEAKTKAWLEGLKANLNAKPSGNDRAQARQIHAGTCDIAIANTYYLGKMSTNEKKPEQKLWYKSLRPVFLKMPNGKAHINLSGMVMARHAPNADNARKLMAFMVSPEAQAYYAQVNFEYPIRTDVAVSELVAGWGAFDGDTLALSDIAKQSKTASKFVDQVDFNSGP